MLHTIIKTFLYPSSFTVFVSIALFIILIQFHPFYYPGYETIGSHVILPDFNATELEAHTVTIWCNKEKCIDEIDAFTTTNPSYFLRFYILPGISSYFAACLLRMVVHIIKKK